MLFHIQKESLSNRQDSKGLSVHSWLAATALLPLLHPKQHCCVPKVFPARPATVQCQGANSSAAGTHCKGSKPQVHRAEDAPQPGTASCNPNFSPQPTAHLQQSCPALRVSTQHQEQCAHPPELLPNHCRKICKASPPPKSPSTFFSEVFSEVAPTGTQKHTGTSPLSGFPLRSF